MSPIYGLTDRGLSFAQIGIIRKGAPKDPNGRAPGKDLEYFRVVFDDAETESAKKFTEVYGAQPKLINVMFPFNDLDQVAQFWLEAYTAGRMVARSDGRIYSYKVDTTTGDVIVKNGVNVKTGQPEPFDPDKPVGHYRNNKGQMEAIWCKGVGRIRVVVPELGRLAYLLLMTTSQHDIMNLSEQLQGIWESNHHRIAGIPLILQRKPRKVSCPDPSDKTKRARRVKWLLSIEPNPLWVQAKLLQMGKDAFALDAGSRQKPAELPASIPTQAGPVEPISDEEGWTNVAPYEDAGEEEDFEDGQFEDAPDPVPTSETRAAEKPWTSTKVSLDTAKAEKSSDGTLYWSMPIEQLTVRFNGIEQKLKANGLTQDQKDGYLMKKDIIKAIIDYRNTPEPVQEGLF